jgi:hypothetical protein
MKRIKLLNDGGYDNGNSVKFPVEVSALPYVHRNMSVGYDVPCSELIRVGFELNYEPESDETLYFAPWEVTTNER